MKNFVILIMVLGLLVGCKRTITVEEVGAAQQLTLEKNDVLSESVQVESSLEGTEYEITRSCTKMGICCKCGFTLSMKHECSCGTWRNCPGNQSVKVKPVTTTFRRVYSVKINQIIQEKKSPLYQKIREQVLAAGTCH